MLSGIRCSTLVRLSLARSAAINSPHGAEVIKVEPVGRGDLARQLGADRALSAAQMGVSFLAQNAGKKSLTLNLKSEQGKAIFHRLLASAQVLVENFRPGVMARLGLDYESLKPRYPELIYCAISGFGQTLLREGPLTIRLSRAWGHEHYWQARR